MLKNYMWPSRDQVKHSTDKDAMEMPQVDAAQFQE